ncbi:MAG: SdrD B-like domain-containing protein [candidate division Zixibacteria bacterium]
MKNLKNLTAIFGILTLLVLGCSEIQNPLDNSDLSYSNPPSFASISLPPGAVLDSAVLSLYAEDFAGTADHHVNIHRVTAPWNEATVTYNNFAASYNPAVAASFIAIGTGWYYCEVTSLVQDWLDGIYPDYGLFIEQPEAEATRFASSEYANPALHPMLKICYSLGGSSECVIIQRGTNGIVSDANIVATLPTTNLGNEDLIYITTVGSYKKQSLFQFSVEVIQELAAIGDTVWIDENQNGLQDGGEPIFPDVTVNLYDCQDNFIATTVTDGDGFYIFDNLTPGDYYVEFIKPEGYDITLQDQGADDAIDSDADPITGKTVCTTLDPGEYDPTWDCGLYLEPQDGCTLTIGFWKTHAGFGPQANVLSQYLPIWLGNAGGSESINVTDSTIAHDILMRNVYGKNKNGITKLYAQMLGAKLNIAAGAEGTDVAAVISAADDFLADHYYTDWNSLNKATKGMVLGWMSAFDYYNNGLTGPGHCD